MKKSASEYNEQNSSMVAFNEYNDDHVDELSVANIGRSEEFDEKINDLCRKLTSTDVDQALYTLKISEKLARKRTISSDDETMLFRQEYGCCHLLRSNMPSRSLLPLARRGRPHFPTRSRRLLCSNCLEIKQKQQTDILQTEQERKRFPLNIHQIEFSLINENEKRALTTPHQYQSAEMLVWKFNTSDNENENNTIDVSYDTGSLTENEKKILLNETIKKLQIVLNNQSIIRGDNIEFTYRTLQTTINILSSSLNSS